MGINRVTSAAAVHGKNLESPMDHSARSDAWYKRAVVIAICIWLVTVVFSLLCGEVNNDEGFYLKAAQRVGQGLLVYRDYPFSQMPLLPYIYAGPVWLFGPSLWVGRLTSIALTAVGMFVWLALVRRYGWRTTAIFFAILAVNWRVTYFTTITKTHPAAFALMGLGALALYRFWRDGRTVMAVAAVLASLALTLVRLPALPMTLAIILGAIVVSWKRRSPAAAVGIGSVLIVAAVGFAAFVNVVGADRLYYNNVGYHLGQSWSMPAVVKLARLPSAGNHLNRVFPLALLFIAVWWAWYERRDRRMKGADASLIPGPPMILLLGAIGIVAGGALHIPSQLDYYFIAVAPLAFFTAINLDRAAARLPETLGRSIPWLVLAVTAVAYAPFDVRERLGVIRQPDGYHLPVPYAEEPAELMRARKRSDGLVATTFVYGTLRPGLDVPVPLTMAEFGCHDVADSTARRLNVVNPGMIRHMIAEGQTEFALIEDLDGGSTLCVARVSDLYPVLRTNYERIAVIEEWGKYKHNISIWQRRQPGQSR